MGRAFGIGWQWLGIVRSIGPSLEQEALRRVPTSWPALGLLALFLVLTRMPALLHPKAIDDEQVYAVVAHEMLQGGQPYRDAIERKPPLLFALYKWIFIAAGARNWMALHVTTIVWTGLTMAALYRVASGLFGAQTGVWAAFLYGLFAAWGDYRNLALNGELLLNLPVVVAFALVIGGPRTTLRPELAIAGSLIGAACLLKQPAAIAVIPIGLYLLRQDYRSPRHLRWSHAVLHVAVFAVAFTLPLVVAGFVLWRRGLLEQAVYWAVLDHRLPLKVLVRRTLANAPRSCLFFAVSTLPLLVAAATSIFRGRRRERYWSDHPAEFAALWMFLLVSIIGVGSNGQFDFHYFLLLLPWLALLGAPFIVVDVDQLSERLPMLRPRQLAAWLALTAVVFLVVDTIGLWRQRAVSVAANYVAAHTAIDDRIFVWGQGDRQTGMYLDADRRPASRHIATFSLTGHFSGRVRPDAWETLQQDFSAHPPRYIIDTDG